MTTQSYDAAGRSLGTAYADGTFVTLAYDALGRVTTMVDPGGTTTYAYSARSELLGKTDPGGLAQGYAYDAVGNRTVLVDPDGGRATTTYDGLSRKVTVKNTQGRVLTFAYDADGRRTTIQHFAGSRRLGFDPLGRIVTQARVDAWGGPIGTIVDAYDPAGRKTSQSIDGTRTTYSYDPRDRLLGQVAAGGCATFAYDSAGSVLVKWHQGSQPVTMAYDAARRPTTVQDGPTLVTYAYDRVGNQTLEDRGGVQTSYGWALKGRRRRERVACGWCVPGAGVVRWWCERTRNPPPSRRERVRNEVVPTDPLTYGPGHLLLVERPGRRTRGRPRVPPADGASI